MCAKNRPLFLCVLWGLIGLAAELTKIRRLMYLTTGIFHWMVASWLWSFTSTFPFYRLIQIRSRLHAFENIITKRGFPFFLYKLEKFYTKFVVGFLQWATCCISAHARIVEALKKRSPTAIEQEIREKTTFLYSFNFLVKKFCWVPSPHLNSFLIQCY